MRKDDVITETLRSQKRNACVREVGQVSVVPQDRKSVV